MVETRVVIVNQLGLHARAAALLVRTAARFVSRIRIERIDGVASADAKSILSVLLLAASRGTELRLSVEGGDEISASEAIQSLIATGFGECVQ